MVQQGLLDVCLESPTRQRSCGPLRGRSRAKAKLKRPQSACTVCGRPPKKGFELPFEWSRVYQEPSNPKLGWCRQPSRKEEKATSKVESSERAARGTEPRASLPNRRLSRAFQTPTDVEAQVDAWRRKVLGPQRNLRGRQASLVDFIDHVLALDPRLDLQAAEPGSPKLSKPRGSTVRPPEPKQEEAVEKMPTLELDMNMTFTNAADRFKLNQIFGQLSVNGDLFVDRVAEALEAFEGKGSDKEWVREILREHFTGRVYLERADFVDFVNLYRRHRHAFMVKIFAEVDQDGSKTLSLSEMVALLGRRGITPVMSCVERIFREVTGEREVRDLSFEEFVQIYDVVQARAGFSENDLVRLRKVWSRYDQDGNQVLSADEVRLALDWQGFVVDASELEALVHEVGRKKGLNQHEFLTFMRKYRDLEVQKLIRTNQSYRSLDAEIVSLSDLPHVLFEIGYEDVAPEVLQECAALVHLVNRDMAVGITSFNPTFNFDGLYHFMENLRASHGFINDERVDLRRAFVRFSCQQVANGFADDSASECEDEEATLSVLKLFYALRWLGYELQLWQVVEQMDGIRMAGSAVLCQEEFLRIMAILHQREIESIRRLLAEEPDWQRATSDGHEETEQARMMERRLERIFQHLGYVLQASELRQISEEFAQGHFSQDVWGVAQALRRHRKKVREQVRRSLGFQEAELRLLAEAFGRMGAVGGVLKGKQLGAVVLELFPKAERDPFERQRALQMLKQVTRSSNCEELAFQEFVHLVRLLLDRDCEEKLEEEHRSLQALHFVPVEVAEFRIIFHKIFLEEKSRFNGHGLLQQVSCVPQLSYGAVEAMLAGIAGDVSEPGRDGLQQTLQQSDAQQKGGLFFAEFLQVVGKLMAQNWHNINDEAQKLVLESWAETEADALYNLRMAEYSRRLD